MGGFPTAAGGGALPTDGARESRQIDGSQQTQIAGNSVSAAGNTNLGTLAAGATWTGTWTDAGNYSQIVTSFKASEAGEFWIEFSADGITVDRRIPAAAPNYQLAANTDQPQLFGVVRRYYRVNYKNTSLSLANLRIETRLSQNPPIFETRAMDNISGLTPTTITQSVITGQNTGEGSYHKVQVTSEGYLAADLRGPVNAFGTAIMVESETPLVQMDFVHGISSNSARTWALNSANSPSAANATLSLGSGTNAAGFAKLESRRLGTYRDGVGLVALYSAKFPDGGLVNSEQTAGPLSEEAGIGVGYDPTDGLFGAIHRTGGLLEVRTFTFSAGAGGAETGTFTIEGVTKTVSLALGSTSVTAGRASEADYSTTGSGWDAHAVGATVVFTSRQAKAHAGAFSFASTGTAAGTFATTRAGAVATDTWVKQTDFSHDVLDGSNSARNPSGFLLRPQFLNVFEIPIQFLGAGGIDIKMEVTGVKHLELVHRFDFAGTRSTATLSTPRSPLSLASKNKGATTDKRVGSCSVKIANQGKVTRLGPKVSLEVAIASLGASYTPLLSIWVPWSWLKDATTYTNWTELFLTTFSVASEASKTCQFQAILSPSTLTGAVWSYLSSSRTPILWDTSATAYTGGEALSGIPIGKTDSSVKDLFPLNYVVGRGERFTILGKSGTGTNQANITLDGIMDV